MLKFGIIGYPLEHSFSPVMHSAAMQYLNIKGEYKPYEIKEDELKAKIKGLKESGLKGFNVTIPHKIKIIPYLDELTKRAKLVGAINTVTITSGKLTGENTDVIGFWEAIPEEIRKELRGKTISILGYGGSACACAIALLLNTKFKTLNIYGRNQEKLLAFKTFILEKIKQLKLKTKVTYNLIKDIDLSDTFTLINTTPIGMYPDRNNSPLKKEELTKLPPEALVCDLIYNPEETKLLKYAKELNKRTLNGTEMLIRQGAASLGIWLNQKVSPIGVMRLALKHNIPE